MSGFQSLVDSLRQYDPREAQLQQIRGATRNADEEMQLRIRQQAMQDRMGESTLATELFNRGRAQTKAPLEDFINNVSTLGPNTGANAAVAQNPSWATQAFQPSSVPMQNAQGTLSEVARGSASNFYNLGPETARQINMQGELLPINRELYSAQGKEQRANTELAGQWGVKAAQAGRADTAAEHAKGRQQQAMSAAMGVMTSMPAVAGAAALFEAVPQVKDGKQAATLIKQIGALRNQIDIAASTGIMVGTAMGGDSNLLQSSVMQQVNMLKQKLDEAHRELYKKYTDEQSSSFSVGKALSGASFTGPDNTTGYTP